MKRLVHPYSILILYILVIATAGMLVWLLTNGQEMVNIAVDNYLSTHDIEEQGLTLK